MTFHLAELNLPVCDSDSSTLEVSGLLRQRVAGRRVFFFQELIIDSLPLFTLLSSDAIGPPLPPLPHPPSCRPVRALI